MLWTYEINSFAEKISLLKVDEYGIAPMENFTGTTIDVTFKNNHTWGCPVYVLNARLQGNIFLLTKWEPCSRAGVYLGHSPFHVISVSLVKNSVTVHVSPQLNVVFDDEFSTVPFIREGKIPPNWKNIVKRRSQSGALENISLRDTWFTPDLEEDTR